MGVSVLQSDSYLTFNVMSLEERGPEGDPERAVERKLVKVATYLGMAGIVAGAAAQIMQPGLMRFPVDNKAFVTLHYLSLALRTAHLGGMGALIGHNMQYVLSVIADLGGEEDVINRLKLPQQTILWAVSAILSDL